MQHRNKDYAWTLTRALLNGQVRDAIRVGPAAHLPVSRQAKEPIRRPVLMPEAASLHHLGIYDTAVRHADLTVDHPMTSIISATADLIPWRRKMPLPKHSKTSRQAVSRRCAPPRRHISSTTLPCLGEDTANRVALNLTPISRNFPLCKKDCWCDGRSKRRPPDTRLTTRSCETWRLSSTGRRGATVRSGRIGYHTL